MKSEFYMILFAAVLLNYSATMALVGDGRAITANYPLLRQYPTGFSDKSKTASFTYSAKESLSKQNLAKDVMKSRVVKTDQSVKMGGGKASCSPSRMENELSRMIDELERMRSGLRALRLNNYSEFSQYFEFKNQDLEKE